MRSGSLVATVIVVLGLVGAAAQEGPAVKPNAAVAPEKVDVTPQLPAEVKQALEEKRDISRGYARAIVALQEKLDAANADLGRAIAQVQQAYPAYDLTDAWTLVKKPTTPKKDEATVKK